MEQTMDMLQYKVDKLIKKIFGLIRLPPQLSPKYDQILS